MHPSPDLALLELDGTLSEAGPAITAAVALALEQVGGRPRSTRRRCGPSWDHRSRTASRRCPAWTRPSWSALWRPTGARTTCWAVRLYVGVLEALQTLYDAGLRLALATSKPQPFAEQVVEAHGLEPLLEAVVGSDRAGGRRTKGDVVAETLRRAVPQRRAVMVGDREHDVRGAAEHGVDCVGVLWGYGDEAELTGAGAVALVGTPDELVQLLLPVGARA